MACRSPFFTDSCPRMSGKRFSISIFILKVVHEVKKGQRPEALPAFGFDRILKGYFFFLRLSRASFLFCFCSLVRGCRAIMFPWKPGGVYPLGRFANIWEGSGSGKADSTIDPKMLEKSMLESCLRELSWASPGIFDNQLVFEPSRSIIFRMSVNRCMRSVTCLSVIPEPLATRICLERANMRSGLRRSFSVMDWIMALMRVISDSSMLTLSVMPEKKGMRSMMSRTDPIF